MFVAKKLLASSANKPRVPNLHSRSSAKRKKVVDVDEDSSSEFDKILIKVLAQLSKSFHEKKEALEEMQGLIQAKTAACEKVVAELTKVKNSMTKKLAEAEARILKEKKLLIVEAKKDATIVILEARILMALDAAAKGFDTSICGVQSWRERLAVLKGEELEVESTPASAAGKISKSPSAKASEATKDPKRDVEMEGRDPEEKEAKEKKAKDLSPIFSFL